jgi:transcriptional regulator with XRE-family HTH domain
VPQRYKTLAAYFEQTGKSKRSLAQRLEVSESYVSLIAAGKRQPSLSLALRIESMTGVPAEALVSQAVAS